MAFNKTLPKRLVAKLLTEYDRELTLTDVLRRQNAEAQAKVDLQEVVQASKGRRRYKLLPEGE